MNLTIGKYFISIDLKFCGIKYGRGSIGYAYEYWLDFILFSFSIKKPTGIRGIVKELGEK